MNRPALEAARRMDLGPYEAWHEPERLLFNVERAYRELRGDPPISTVDVFSLITGVIQLRQERWPERA